MMDGQRRRVQTLRWSGVAAIALLGLQSGCTALKTPAPLASSSPAATATSLPLPPTSSAAGKALPSNFVVDVVQKVGPAVVRINSTRTVQDSSSSNSPLGRFFELPQQDRSTERVDRGTGSGFIFDAQGLVMTNAHVVDKADQVMVLLKDGRQFKGKVLGEDPLTDIAVIKIEASNLPTVRLGNSKLLLPGEWAIAIGNPLGLDNTVTVGIISATGRSGSEIGISDRRVRFIQTDAAINPGNSGGPLLNAAGQVIGVNTAIIQNAQGLGFSIPIDSAQLIAQQLVASGKVEHAYLGVQMVDLTPELRDQINQQEKLNLGADNGVLVVKVMPNSPAAAGGIKSGDLVQSINEQPMRTTDDVQQAVEAARPGGMITVQVKQKSQPRSLRITLSKLNPQELISGDRP
jgi:serine protease Do